VRVHEYTREELQELQEEGETYTDVLNRILPDEVRDECIIKDDGEAVAISVSQDVHELVDGLAGDGVSMGKVVDYYLLKHRVKSTLPADELLKEVYRQ